MRARTAAVSATTAAALVCALAAAAVAQPRAQTGPAPAPPDTVLLSLGAAAGTPRPTMSLGAADTLRFGEPFTLICDLPPGSPTIPDSVAARADWFKVSAPQPSWPPAPPPGPAPDLEHAGIITQLDLIEHPQHPVIGV